VIETEVHGAAKWIFISNPQVVNAVGLEDLQELSRLVREAAAEPEIALIVLGGRGGNFCSGDNLKESGSLDRAAFRSLIAAFQELTWAVDRAPKPVAAFVEGYALGGGAEIALMCDLVVAVRTATIGCPEVALGGMISNGSTAFLGELLGPHRAAQLVLLSERWRADDPALAGVFSFVGERDEGLRWIETAAERLASSPPRAVTRAREALRSAGRQARLAASTEELMYAMELYEDPAYQAATARFGARPRGEDDDGPSAHPDC
jgi:enoyl-CoA hydratase/carnithine racemase